MGRSHICQPLRRFAPPPHEWGGACFHAPLPDPLPCGERGIQIGSAPPAASPPPPHKWGGALFHAPLPDPLPWGERGLLARTPLPVPPAPRFLSIALLVGVGLGWIWGLLFGVGL